MADQDDKAHQDGHSPAALDLTRALAALGEQIEQTDAENQLDLLSGSPEEGASDLLTRAANTVTEGRKGAGRPAGAKNKRNTQVFDYLEALGHRDPIVTLSLLQTASTDMLAVFLDCDRLEAAKLQLAAAKELMPYKYAKRPTEVKVESKALHLFLTGDMNAGDNADDEPQFVDAPSLSRPQQSE